MSQVSLQVAPANIRFALESYLQAVEAVKDAQERLAECEHQVKELLPADGAYVFRMGTLYVPTYATDMRLVLNVKDGEFKIERGKK